MQTCKFCSTKYSETQCPRCGDQQGQNFFTPRPLDLSREQEIRSDINRWAKSIPHHDLTDLGNRVKLTQHTAAPVYRAKADVWIEGRSVRAKTEVWKGGSSTLKSAKDVDVWSFNFDKFDPMAKDDHGFTERLPGSECMVACYASCENGKVDCSTCEGNNVVNCGCNQGHVHCGTCRGKGVVEKSYEVDRWRESFTTGKKELYTETQYRTEHCMATGCNQGWVVHKQCGGRGILKCPHCPDGRVTCATCRGHGKLTQYFELDINYNVFKESITAHTEPSMEKDGVNPGGTDYTDILAEIKYERIADACAYRIGFEPIDKKVEAHLLIAQNNHHVRKMEVKIQRASLARVDYEFEGKPFFLAVFGHNRQIHAKLSPISKAITSLLGRAEKCFQSFDLKGGIEILKQAWSSGQSRDQANAIYKKLCSTSQDSFAEAVKKYSDRGLVLEANRLVVSLNHIRNQDGSSVFVRNSVKLPIYVGMLVAHGILWYANSRFAPENAMACSFGAFILSLAVFKVWPEQLMKGYFDTRRRILQMLAVYTASQIPFFFAALYGSAILAILPPLVILAYQHLVLRKQSDSDLAAIGEGPKGKSDEQMLDYLLARLEAEKESIKPYFVWDQNGTATATGALAIPMKKKKAA